MGGETRIQKEKKLLGATIDFVSAAGISGHSPN